MERRVVITGLGAITPIGKDVNESWNSILNKKCGIDNISLFDNSTFKTKVDAEVKNYESQEYFDLKQSKRLDRSSQFAIIASREAFKDSGITKENTDFERVGVFVSSGIAGLSTIQEQCTINCTKGHNRISPMFIPMSIANMPAGNVAIELGLKGESISTVSACSSSTHAIGEAYRTIKYGAEDVILAGGTESSICEIGIAGFENMKALSFATDPNRASIPFDKERGGFVIGEGAGVVVLEELEHAKARGARIYAEVVGYGATADAYHITSPIEDGSGAARAMTDAMKEAGVQPEEIDYINAHGTGTHHNDLFETRAIKAALGDAAKKVKINSTKSMIGHLLGAAGGVEAVVCVKSIEEGFIHQTVGTKETEEELDLDYCIGGPTRQEVNYAMSNSLGFGGHNAVLLMKKYR